LDAINPTFITCSLLVIADDDVEDVIALMRLNYERVVERHALPAVGSRAFRSLSRSPIPPGRIALPGVALVHGHISSAPAVIEVTDENEPTRDERSPGDLSGCSRVPPVGLVQKNGG
jgi:hypothetical protein